MSNDLLDKNGVWQGTLKQYYDFAKDIIEDALNDEDEQIQEALMIGFKDLIIDLSISVNTKWSPKLDQDKLEKSISLFAYLGIMATNEIIEHFNNERRK